jgi:hypothetical protein
LLPKYRQGTIAVVLACQMSIKGCDPGTASSDCRETPQVPSCCELQRA